MPCAAWTPVLRFERSLKANSAMVDHLPVGALCVLFVLITLGGHLVSRRLGSQRVHPAWSLLDHLPTRISLFWTRPLPLTRPALTMKLFVLALLCLELLALPAPELCVLSTPELIGVVRAHPHNADSDIDIPRITKVCMPTPPPPQHRHP